MHAVVKAVSHSTHALVESPTGTGKSLALLCSSLAVQTHLRTHAPASTGQTESIPSTSHRGGEQKNSNVPTSPPPANSGTATKPNVPQPLSPQPVSHSNAGTSDDDDFQPQKAYRDISWQRPPPKSRKRPVEEEELPHNAFMLTRHDNPLDASITAPAPADDENPETPKKRVPRIFYASRTHNQVTQVVHELRKTAYRPHIAILASRKEYCVQETVRDSVTRDDTCKRMVAESGCPFFFDAQKLADSAELIGEAWDIEELTNLGTRTSACPYYASHELYQRADLIFCPYSFLVDPVVREARGINLSGDVVILDEAHNIENYARDAASFSADVADMQRVVNDVETMILTSRMEDVSKDLVLAYRRLKTLLEAFLSLVEDVVSADSFEQHDNYENAVFEREDLLQVLSQAEITADELKYWRASHTFITHFGDGNESKRVKRMGLDRVAPNDIGKGDSDAREHATSPKKNMDVSEDPTSEKCKNSSDSTIRMGGYGYGHDPHADVPDASKEEKEDSGSTAYEIRRQGRRRGRFARKGRRGASAKDEAQPKRWISKCVSVSHSLLTTLAFLFEHADDFALVVDRRTSNLVTVVTLSIHCLNAAVCFREISSRARSVVVASGTLSPMTSFAGELGTSFAVSKSLPHVIDVRRQLCLCIAGQGPRNVRMDSTFGSASRFEFQDALADALIDYCRVIPGGVLVFFPSYRLMHAMRTRWTTCGAWDRLADVKGAVLAEPTERGAEFDDIVSRYQAASREPSGALLFAVCRGKLSEGIDFRDDTSRAVVIVGIPFPYKKDVVVNLKRQWNDRARKQSEAARKTVMHGGQWYEMQAFRAVNQALGRVVRHRYDYGAIVLVDYRFQQQRVLEQLSQWTRSAVCRTDSSHNEVVQQLEAFYEGVHMKLADISKENNRA